MLRKKIRTNVKQIPHLARSYTRDTTTSLCSSSVCVRVLHQTGNAAHTICVVHQDWGAVVGEGAGGNATGTRVRYTCARQTAVLASNVAAEPSLVAANHWSPSPASADW